MALQSRLIEILFVCTGNVCRSPMAEHLLRRALRERGVDDGVSSAGLLPDGMPAAPEVIEILQGRGLDASSHRSRTVTPEILDASDLVVGMAREHVRELALMAPAVLPRSFTLKELVRRGDEVGPRRGGESLGAWVERAQDGRFHTAHLGASGLDDIEDPIGRRFAVFKKTAAEIDGLIGRLADLAWPRRG